MKKHFRIALLAVLTVLMVGLLALAVCAAEPAETDFYEVLDAEGTHIGYKATLKDAVTGLQANGTYTIKLLKDATEDSVANLKVAGVTVTLDGNGHKIQMNKNFAVTKAVNLTIKNVTISAANADAKWLYVTQGAVGATITIESGTYSGLMDNVSASVTIKGGSFSASDVWLAIGAKASAATVTIENGEFNGKLTNDSAKLTIKGGVFRSSGTWKTVDGSEAHNPLQEPLFQPNGTWLSISKVTFGVNVTIENGTFYGELVNDGAVLEISGGTFYAPGSWADVVDPVLNVVTDQRYSTTRNWLTIGIGTVAPNPEEGQTALEDALSTIKNGTFYGCVCGGGGPVTILGGTFSSSYATVRNAAAKNSENGSFILIKGGTFTTTGDACILIFNFPSSKQAEAQPDKACVVIDGGKFIGATGGVLDIQGTPYFTLMRDELKAKGDYTLEEVRALIEEKCPGPFYSVVINGGEMINENNGGNSNIFWVRNDSWNCKLIINDGTFTHRNGSRGGFNAAGATVIINGGEFSSDVKIVSAHDGDCCSPIVINGGTFTALKSAYVLLLTSGVPNKNSYPLTTILPELHGQALITGGKFYSEAKYCISFGDAASFSDRILTITGGEFSSGGDAVIRVRPKTEGDVLPTLNIKGGVFRLLKGDSTDAALIYDKDNATFNLIIEGGTFIDERKGNKAIISTISSGTTCNLTVTGGIFLVEGEDQDYFFNTKSIKSNMDADFAPVYQYEGKEYFMFFIFPLKTDTKVSPTQTVVARVDAENPGIRFETTFPKAQLDALKEKFGADAVFSYGTIVMTMNTLFDVKEASHEALKAYAATKEKTDSQIFVDIPAVKGIVQQENGDVLIRASLVKIKDAHTTQFVIGLAYVKVTVGETVTYVYTDASPSGNCSTMRGVANTALNDIKMKANDRYKFGSETGKGFSPYSKAQQEALKKFLGA